VFTYQATPPEKGNHQWEVKYEIEMDESLEIVSCEQDLSELGAHERERHESRMKNHARSHAQRHHYKYAIHMA
jgi:hypothetical protein